MEGRFHDLHVSTCALRAARSACFVASRSDRAASMNAYNRGVSTSEDGLLDRVRGNLQKNDLRASDFFTEVLYNTLHYTTIIFVRCPVRYNSSNNTLQ